MTITARTRLFGLIGYPLGHSLSPAIQNAALRACGLEGVYLALPVPSAQLAGAMAGVRAWRLAGLNVTVPHKVAVVEYLDGLTPEAARVGAVNTIFWDGDRLLGDNTDVAGYEAMLARSGVLPNRTAVLLGTGGAARAVVHVLVRHGFTVRLVGRRVEAAAALAEEVGRTSDWAPGLKPGADAGLNPGLNIEPSAGNGPVIKPLTWHDRVAALEGAGLLVNATPLGMGESEVSPLDPDVLSTPGDRESGGDLRPEWTSMLAPGAVVHDLVYSPLETALLRQATAGGLRTVDGGVMLVEQAAAAFSRWTGRPAPLERMGEAFRLANAP